MAAGPKHAATLNPCGSFATMQKRQGKVLTSLEVRGVAKLPTLREVLNAVTLLLTASNQCSFLGLEKPLARFVVDQLPKH